LSSLTELGGLSLGGNQIIDVSPLVQNSGLGQGDIVWLGNNPLDLRQGSQNRQDIETLKTRGVMVLHDPIVGAVHIDVRMQGRGSLSGVAVYVNGNRAQPSITDVNILIGGIPEGDSTISLEMPGYLKAERTGVSVAYAQTTTLPPVALLGGDANNDGIIDVADLVLAAGQFGPSAPGAPADINGDGVVNIMDLALAGMNFGKTESPWTG
ncbi:MAG: hypothetical protein Q7T04_08195, partial [Dehalococcoidia bacterium]|nr:hypothetical protein [Dehalococcoidia bacterium]